LMATHVSHVGVHDHGFNNISTYGNLWRLMREGKISFNEREKDFYELALKVSGAIQAARWTTIQGVATSPPPLLKGRGLRGGVRSSTNPPSPRKGRAGGGLGSTAIELSKSKDSPGIFPLSSFEEERVG